MDLIQTLEGIDLVKRTFKEQLCEGLRLLPVPCPYMVKKDNGLQDDLAGTQVPVSFVAQHVSEDPLEIVHSLAKWKRHFLWKHEKQISPNMYEGIVTNMHAIRKDEQVDETHSIFVDQWDWEKIIPKKARNLDTLKSVVRTIYKAIKTAEATLHQRFPTVFQEKLAEDIIFVHSEELEEMYPHLSPADRETQIVRDLTKKHPKQKCAAVFLIGIGAPLPKSKQPHDLRAADYDDWTTVTEKGYMGLNGDILVYDRERDSVLELSSMGIRVDRSALVQQLKAMGKSMKCVEEKEYHKGILEDRLPQTIGGGIGQSRLCMFLLSKKHIGEVQSSVWPNKILRDSREVTLL